MTPDPKPILDYASPTPGKPTTRHAAALALHFLGFFTAGACTMAVSVFSLGLTNRYLGASLSFIGDLLAVAFVGFLSTVGLGTLGTALLHVGPRKLPVPPPAASLASGLAAALLMFAPIVIDHALTDQATLTLGGDPASTGWGAATGWTLAFALHPLLIGLLLIRRPTPSESTPGS